MFEKLRKTKDLAQGEYLIGKPDKTPPFRILAYGLLFDNNNIKYAIHDFDEFEVDDEPLGASVSFLDYNGVVLFAGAFEKVESSFFGEKSIKCIARSDLDLREREIHTVIKKNDFLIFLIPHILKDDYNWSSVIDTDLFRRFLASFQISWGCSKEAISHLDSKIPEFQPYIERYGSAYVFFLRGNDNKDFTKVICGNDDNPVAFSIFDKVFFLPCVYPTTHEQALGAVESSIRTVISYQERISKAKPEWISEFRFTQESSLLGEAKELQRQLNMVETKIDSYSNFKGALCYRSDPLVDIVINIFEKFFEISLVKEDEFVEDASLKDESGNRKAIFEIKGVKKNFSRQNINQVDSHKERLGLQPKTPGILVMNTLMDAESLAEKDQPPHPDIIKKAVTDNVLLVRTIDLLRFADSVESSILKKEDFLATLMNQSGWLKVADNKYEVIKN